MKKPSQRITTAALLIVGVVAANAAFVGLGSTFAYPDILQQPASKILERFDQTRASTMVWFAVLATAAAIFGLAAIGVARLSEGRAARWSQWAGVAAAVVQVVGLSRWLLLVPGYADRATDATAPVTARVAAVADFEFAHRLLGTYVGETLGYTLTALWTMLVLRGLGTGSASRWFARMGRFAAALILTGVLVPFGVAGADLANFVGYVLWSVWIVALSARLVRPLPMLYWAV
jgi:hypothetical protein